MNNPKPIWRVESIGDFDTTDVFALKLQKVMNRLEDEGYELSDPKPIGKHYFVCGRLPKRSRKRKS